MAQPVPRKRPSGKARHCKGWEILTILIILIVSITFLLYSFLEHNADDSLCNCIHCVLNHTPEEGEYIYNRYLILISLSWITLLFAILLLVHQYYVKKNKKK